MQQNEEETVKFRIIVIGSPSVGKATFCDTIATDCQWDLSLIYKLGYGLYERSDSINNQTIKAEIWSTLGYERYRRKLLSEVEKCDGIILMYDITEEEGFEEVQMWIDHLQGSHIGPSARLLLGNQIDIDDQRKISYEEGRQLGEKFQSKFVEVSAKASDGTNHAYKLLLEMLLEQKKLQTKLS